jgi:UDP-3-O-[3-hydroxymyristoyl] N-acetylglucosamine deacetylase/3-hydroxyacyl-[acyl-carrier-protein] dehydratase
VSVNLNRRPFIEELAPARTFTSKPEAEAARAAGQFEHLSPCDILVFDRGCPVDNDLRFPDEPARHKALDLVGDLALTGRPVRGRFIAHRSGHQLNRDMARALLAQDRARRLADAPLGAAAYLRSTPAATATPSALDAASGHPGADSAFPQGLSIKKIMGLMPHRFPMLLVDRVLEIDANRRAVGVKNVTINEPMFQGHYPNNPIMPGVLVVEAMAQLAGLMLHETLEHDEKIALLLSLERVKLRKPVIPGDQLRLESELVRSNRRSADVHCRSFVEAELAAEARVKFLMVDKAFDRG